VGKWEGGKVGKWEGEYKRGVGGCGSGEEKKVRRWEGGKMGRWESEKVGRRRCARELKVESRK